MSCWNAAPTRVEEAVAPEALGKLPWVHGDALHLQAFKRRAAEDTLVLSEKADQEVSCWPLPGSTVALHLKGVRENCMVLSELTGPLATLVSYQRAAVSGPSQHGTARHLTSQTSSAGGLKVNNKAGLLTSQYSVANDSSASVQRKWQQAKQELESSTMITSSPYLAVERGERLEREAPAVEGGRKSHVALGGVHLRLGQIPNSCGWNSGNKSMNGSSCKRGVALGGVRLRFGRFGRSKTWHTEIERPHEPAKAPPTGSHLPLVGVAIVSRNVRVDLLNRVHSQVRPKSISNGT